MTMLKKVVLLAMCAALLTACAPKPADTTADEATIKADPANWFQAFNGGDADGVAKLYADDAVLMPPGTASISGRAAIKDYVASEIPKMKEAGLTFVLGDITGSGVSGDLGWLGGLYSVKDGSGAEKDKGKFLSVYHRGSEGWKLIRDTWNSDMAPAAAAAPPAAAAPTGAAGAAPAKP